MLYTTKPEVFDPKFDVVSCFVEYKGRILLLHRQDHKPQGNTYGVPAGKVDAGEDIWTTVRREIEEETWLQDLDIQYFAKTYVKYPEYDFHYHMFHVKLTEEPSITTNPKEHKWHIRKHPHEVILMDNLIEDEDVCVKMFYWL